MALMMVMLLRIYDSGDDDSGGVDDGDVDDDDVDGDVVDDDYRSCSQPDDE